jgi:hypothetical protein
METPHDTAEFTYEVKDFQTELHSGFATQFYELFKLFSKTYNYTATKMNTFMKIGHGYDKIARKDVLIFSLSTSADDETLRDYKSNCHYCRARPAIGHCEDCKYTRYCSKKCQLKHWNIHKVICEDFSKLLEQNALMKY